MWQPSRRKRLPKVAKRFNEYPYSLYWESYKNNEVLSNNIYAEDRDQTITSSLIAMSPHKAWSIDSVNHVLVGTHPDPLIPLILPTLPLQDSPSVDHLSKLTNKYWYIIINYICSLYMDYSKLLRSYVLLYTYCFTLCMYVHTRVPWNMYICYYSLCSWYLRFFISTSQNFIPLSISSFVSL